MTDATIVKLSIPFIVAAFALALAALVLAVRMFFRPLPLPPLPEPDPCTEAARELEMDPGGDDDDGETEELAAAHHENALITIGWALFTPAEVKRMEAMRERIQAGAA